MLVFFALYMFTVYILYSQKLNKYYTGFTTNLNVRFVFHTNSESKNSPRKLMIGDYLRNFRVIQKHRD